MTMNNNCIATDMSKASAPSWHGHFSGGASQLV